MASVSTPELQNQAGARSAPVLKHLAIRLCLSISLGLGLLVLGELAAFLKLHAPRIEEQDRHLALYRGRDWGTEYWREFAAADTVQYQAYTVWRRKGFRGRMISIDESGLRRTIPSRCDADAYTIWMFGNSALWGTGARDWETIPSFLAVQYEKAGRRVCVKNYGEKAWVSTQELIALTLALKDAAHKPDLVIFYDGETDTFLPYQSTAPDVHQNFVDIKKRFETQDEDKGGFGYLHRSNTFQLLQRLAAKLKLHNPTASIQGISDAAASAMAGATLENYLKNVEIIETLAKHYGFQCLFFWQPNLVDGQKPLSAEEEFLRQREEKAYPGEQRLYQTTYALVQANSRDDLVYLGDLFREHRETLYFDLGHISPEGNLLIAKRIFEILQDRGL